MTGLRQYMSALKITGIKYFFSFLIVFGLPCFVWAAINPITVAPVNLGAGVTTNHTITFTTSLPIPANGKILVDYSGTFGINGVVMSTPNPNINGSFSYAYEPAISRITITRSGDGTATPAGQLSITLLSVTNASTPGTTYTVAIETKDGSNLPIETGVSSNFTITYGPLADFTITASSLQTAGASFALNVTNAQDQFGNPWSGLIDVDLYAGELISPGGISSTVQDVVVTNGQGSRNQTLTSAGVAVFRGLADGTTRYSNPVTVSPSTLDAFVFEAESGIMAGRRFVLSVSGAQDFFGNDWSGSINVTAISPTGNLNSPNGAVPTVNDIWVDGGRGQAFQTLVKAEIGVTLLGEQDNETRMITNITVGANKLASLKIRNSANNAGRELVDYSMSVGDTLHLYSAGYDAYGNYRGEELTNWTSSGFTPEVSLFNRGSIDFVRTSPGSGTITASDPDPASNIFDNTGTVTILPGSVTAFKIDKILTQMVGQPFIITVRAVDAFENTDINFSGTVQITDLTGTIRPSVSGIFRDGVWTNVVTVYQEIKGDTIKVKQVNGPAKGASLPFDVIAGQGVRIVEFEALKADTISSLNTITTNQDLDWFLKFVIENVGSNTVRLDSVQMKFLVDGILRQPYDFDGPANFWGNKVDTLQAGATDSLLIRINKTGNDAGTATIRGFVYLSNIQTGAIFSDQSIVTLVVQTPAELVIQEVRPSQQEVTRGQEEDWRVTVTVSNIGGSSVTLDSSRTETYVAFNRGAGWRIARPDSLNGGGWILSGGETDYLVYTIQRTGDGATGTATISAKVEGIENNTGEAVFYSTQGGQEGNVLLEDPAYLRIVQVENLAPNAPYVNTGQDFSVRVTVENAGGDGIHDVQVLLLSDGLSVFPPLPVSINSLSGGEIKSVDFAGSANSIPNPMEVFTGRVEGRSDNTDSFITNDITLNDTTKAVIQYPANLLVESVTTSASSVVGGQVDPWTVKVAVRNTGHAVVIFDLPNAEDLSFWNGGLYQADYKVRPPVSLMRGGLNLPGGTRDTLIYSVITTGRLGGEVEVRAQVNGRDKNTSDDLTGGGMATVDVLSEQAFRIISTQVITPNKTDAGNGYVNREQAFQIAVVVENGLGETVKNVRVRLNSDGGSLSGSVNKTISRLTPAKWDTVKYDVQASPYENFSGEKFAATITQATLENTGLPAPVGTALDSIAVVVIQRPADLALVLNLNTPSGQVSTNQKFKLTAILVNNGTGEVDNSGRVRIVLPANYQLDAQSPNEILPISTETDAEWTITAPGNPQPARLIYVTLNPSPIELNTGVEVDVDEATVSIEVTTVQSWLSTTLQIASPLGAIDARLSTGQNFVVRARIQSSNAKDITARIELPYGYTTVDNQEKSVISDEVYWQVQAPNIIMTSSLLQVTANGFDALTNDALQASTGRLFISTEMRANLTLSLSILSPPEATDGTISLGQIFVVGAQVVNTGQADTLGFTEVTLDPLPTGYRTSGSLTQKLVNGVASWAITAPLQPTGEAVNIEARITKTPQDENTNQEAYVSRGNHSVAVLTGGAWLSVSNISLYPTTGSSVIPGEDNVKLMALELDNRGITGANPIVIYGIDFIVEDRFGDVISPNAALSKVFVVDEADLSQVGSTTQISNINPVSINFDRPVTVPVDQNRRISVYGRISTNPSVVFFQLNIPDEDYIDAKEAGNPVNVRTLTEDELEDMRSEPKRIFHPEVESTFRIVPNPFGESGKEYTLFIYYLNEQTDVSFHIYTLTGELVWSRSYTENDPQGSIGMHASLSHSVRWDGRNDRGVKVLNGVYILVMQTGTGEVLTTKIAVVK